MSTELIWQTVSTSSADTEKLGRLLGSLLSPPACVELASDLGGGKTTFMRGFAAGLKSKDPVTSPTFTLSKIYKFAGGEIHHFDFYRLSEPGILKDELAESLNDSKVIVAVEWSDIVKDVLPDKRLRVEFEPQANDPDERQIIIKYPIQYEPVVRQLQSKWNELEP